MVDMPLNNHPTTVSKETLELKVSVIDQMHTLFFPLPKVKFDRLLVVNCRIYLIFIS